MFKRNSNRESGRINGKIDTLISYGTEIEGTIHSPSNLRIDGILRGEVLSMGVVVIGERGEAHSNITAQTIVVAGKVIGELKSEGRLTITASGNVSGNCQSKYLVVHEGGILNGSSHTDRSDVNVEQKAVEKQSSDKLEPRKGKRDEKMSEKQVG